MNYITITISASTNGHMLAVRTLQSDIVDETQKAVKISNGNHTMWLPKSAIKGDKLARWFKPNGYQDWYIMNYSTVGFNR